MTPPQSLSAALAAIPWGAGKVTPALRLLAALEAIHWSGRHLASILGYDERQVRRWASGDYAMPDGVLDWLETLAAFHEAHPPPRK